MDDTQQNDYQEEPQEQQAQPEQRRSIRDLRLSNQRPQQRREVRQVVRESYDDAKSSMNRWVIYAAGAVVACLGLFALLPVMFPKATVVVTPVKVQTGADVTLIANPEAKDGEMVYSVEGWDVASSRKLQATVTETVAEKASGTIKVANANGRDQKLIKNTRFEGKNGKIYRIRDSIVVPAQGTLEVKVYADEGGDSFNVESTTFTLPGLKSSDLFTKVTAETVSAITGGFSGTRKSVSATEKKKLTDELEHEVIEKVKAGEGYTGTGLLVRKTTSASVDGVSEKADGDSVTLSVVAHAKAVFVEKAELAYGLSAEAGSHVNSKHVTFVDAIPALEAAEAVDLAQLGKKPIKIKVPGTHSLVYIVDRVALAKGLAGISRDSVKQQLSQFPEIEKAVATIRPFWNNSLPSNSEKITILLEGEEEK